ncbi:hypothetical protein GUJ93_ZPchr0005g14903 [Zizania palustris]|uniref:Uncharacterized protein n=1 Tax=Zizania palustris TaxID=103762 RepID=A0A8J5SLW5_ZIZPA|nr:hypothetical protein GUJ93_ZPchr0005g14903 [Zizania palustris]
MSQLKLELVPRMSPPRRLPSARHMPRASQSHSVRLRNSGVALALVLVLVLVLVFVVVVPADLGSQPATMA